MQVELSEKELQFLLNMLDQVPLKGLATAAMLGQVASKFAKTLQQNGAVSVEVEDDPKE